MDDGEIDGELRARGIDPIPAVERMTLFVRDAVADWRNRRLLHRSCTYLTRLIRQMTALLTCAPCPSWRA